MLNRAYILHLYFYLVKLFYYISVLFSADKGSQQKQKTANPLHKTDWRLKFLLFVLVFCAGVFIINQHIIQGAGSTMFRPDFFAGGYIFLVGAGGYVALCFFGIYVAVQLTGIHTP